MEPALHSSASLMRLCWGGLYDHKIMNFEEKYNKIGAFWLMTNLSSRFIQCMMVSADDGIVAHPMAPGTENKTWPQTKKEVYFVSAKLAMIFWQFCKHFLNFFIPDFFREKEAFNVLFQVDYAVKFRYI